MENTMKYYIYGGGGGNGQVIMRIIDFLNRSEGLNNTYEVVDDSNEKTSLETLCHKIKNDTNSLVLVASVVHQAAMIAKMKKLKIKHFVDGIAFMGKALNKWFKEHYSTYKKVIFLLDDVGLKHFGKIDILLKEKDYKVFYFFFEHKTQLQNDFMRLNGDSFIITEDFLKYFDFCYLMIGTSMHYCFANNVKYFRLLASYDIPFYHSRYHTIEQITRHLCEYSVGSHLGFYFAVQNKKSLNELKSIPGIRKECLLEVGYPSLDNLVKEYESFNSHLKQDTIICLSRFNKKGFRRFLLERMNEVIDFLLGRGYRVCYKVNPHYNYELQKENAARWNNFDNFIFFEEASLSLEELFRSITIVDFSASMLYTYPLITKKPAIMLGSFQKWFAEEKGIFLNEDNFYDERLHIWANNNCELEEIILALQNNKDFSNLREKMIRDYILNETFAWGHSSEKIVETIDTYIENFNNMDLVYEINS